jgi:hypothetical protein
MTQFLLYVSCRIQAMCVRVLVDVEMFPVPSSAVFSLVCICVCVNLSPYCC